MLERDRRAQWRVPEATTDERGSSVRHCRSVKDISSSRDLSTAIDGSVPCVAREVKISDLASGIYGRYSRDRRTLKTKAVWSTVRADRLKRCGKWPLHLSTLRPKFSAIEKRMLRNLARLARLAGARTCEPPAWKLCDHEPLIQVSYRRSRQRVRKPFKSKHLADRRNLSGDASISVPVSGIVYRGMMNRHILAPQSEGNFDVGVIPIRGSIAS